MLEIVGFAYAIGLVTAAAVIMRLTRRRIVVDTDSILDESEAENPFTLLSIAVPRENIKTPAAAEQMFAALHGIFRPSDEQPIISFEISVKNQRITFYVYTPTNLKEFVSSQIFAQYPLVEIDEIDLNDDYAQVGPGLTIAATELDIKREPYYPIKTFQNFDVDPLSAITGVLGTVGQNEELWIQTLIKPISDDWQADGEKLIKIIRGEIKAGGFIELIVAEIKELIKTFGQVLISGKGPEEKQKEPSKKELTGAEEQAIKAIEEKITRLGFAVNIRIIALAPNIIAARSRIEQVVAAYKQYNALHLNSFIAKSIIDDNRAIELYRQRDFGVSNVIFNTLELASLFHLPSETVETPLINWAGSKKGEPPANLPISDDVLADDITTFAVTDFRKKIQRFGIKKQDRRLHTYVIGKTGTGKSTMLENMIIDDIRRGRGLSVVDPHGELIQHILRFVPEDRIDDVIYFSPADLQYPIGFNVLESVDPNFRNVVASGVVGIFKKIFGESWGPRLEYILRNVILALLEYPNSTLLSIMRVLTDTPYRRQILSNVTDPVIRDFFINEFEKYDQKFRMEAIAPIQNKVGQFLSSTIIRNIIGQPTSSINMKEVMDEGKILLIDLSIGKIGEDSSALLGAMMITKMQLAAMSRSYISESERNDFYLYVDEFQNFATDSFAVILSEARKYRLNLIMTHQYIAQMPETVSKAVFGNVGTLISFRVGSADAEVLSKELEPIFTANDLVNLDNYHIYLKMAIDGVTMPAFSARTLPPKTDYLDLTEAIINRSRAKYGRPRSDVEDYISSWAAPVEIAQLAAQSIKHRDGDEANASELEKVTADSNLNELIEKDKAGDKDKIGETAAQKRVADDSVDSARQILNARISWGREVDIMKDRFGRNWFAVKRGDSAKENQESLVEKKKTDQPPENRGEEVELLIKSEEIEQHLQKQEAINPAIIPKTDDADEIIPIDEL